MRAPVHSATVVATPHPGVFATYSDGDLHFAKHWHTTYGFGLLDAGGQSWMSGRGRVDAYPGDVIDTNPGEVHDGRPIGGRSRSWRIVSLDPALMVALTDLTGPVPEIARPVIHDPRLSAALQRLFHGIDAWTTGTRSDSTRLAFHEALVESCSLLVAGHGSRQHTTCAAAADMLVVRDALGGSAGRAPSLDALGRLTGLSKFQVIRQFRRRFGMPPHAWLLCHRAERARALIRQGVALSMAAARCGFADQSHMTRTFRRLYGYSPGAWQRAWPPRNGVQDRH